MVARSTLVFVADLINGSMRSSRSACVCGWVCVGGSPWRSAGRCIGCCVSRVAPWRRGSVRNAMPNNRNNHSINIGEAEATVAAAAAAVVAPAGWRATPSAHFADSLVRRPILRLVRFPAVAPRLAPPAPQPARHSAYRTTGSRRPRGANGLRLGAGPEKAGQPRHHRSLASSLRQL